MRLNTKENRMKYLDAKFDRLTSEGNKKEVYKKLTFFYKPHLRGFTLLIYRGTSTNPVLYSYMPTINEVKKYIEQYKSFEDRREERERERKERNKGKRSTSVATCADSIRAELKKQFPGIKFSVRSETFSMGNSVRISWTDGPTRETIEKISNKYQYGHFDGMNDIYINSNHREDIPQAKWVTCDRSMSEETKAGAMPCAEVIFLGGHSYARNAEDLIYQVFQVCEIPQGKKVAGILRKNKDFGVCRASEWFYFTFEAKKQRSCKK